MAKWDLSKLPEGRKPLPDESFAERAQMQDRIEELEAKLDKAVELETVKILVTSAYKEGWSDGTEFISLDVAWESSSTRTTLAELTGGKDE